MLPQALSSATRNDFRTSRVCCRPIRFKLRPSPTWLAYSIGTTYRRSTKREISAALTLSMFTPEPEVFSFSYYYNIGVLIDHWSLFELFTQIISGFRWLIFIYFALIEICIADSYTLSQTASEDDVKAILTEMYNQKNARGVVMFLQDHNIRF